jgi:hypothetical protein
MAGTLVISTLSDGTNSTSATNPVRGSAKAWVNFDGSLTGTNAGRVAYNVSSITKNSAGDYTINFPSGVFTTTTYLMMGSIASNYTSSSTTPIIKSATQLGAPVNQTTTACQIITPNYSSSLTDNVTYIYCAFFGN